MIELEKTQNIGIIPKANYVRKVYSDEYNKIKKEQFEFVRHYEHFDLYKHKTAGFYECF